MASPAATSLAFKNLERRAAAFFSPTEWIIVGVVTALVQFGTAFVYGIGTETDFAIFQRSTARFVDGRAMYSPDAFDFTPPLFHVLLLPLAHVDPRIGFVLWTAANVVLAWLVVGVILRSVPGAWTRRGVIVAWIVNAAGTQMTLRLGQVTWLVALLVTLAWLAARSSRWIAAGLWAGVAVAFKPFLLVVLPVFAVRRRWTALAVCGASAIACCGLSVLVFGWGSFEGWLGNLRATPDPGYAVHFLNASWVAVVSRARAPHVIATLLSAATLLAMAWRARTSDEDATWLILSIASLLASPVGWVYYEPMMLGPALALALDGRIGVLRWAAPALVFPALSSSLFQYGSPIVAATLGSIYFWGLVGVFVALMRQPHVRTA